MLASKLLVLVAIGMMPRPCAHLGQGLSEAGSDSEGPVDHHGLIMIMPHASLQRASAYSRPAHHLPVEPKSHHLSVAPSPRCTIYALEAPKARLSPTPINTFFVKPGGRDSTTGISSTVPVVVHSRLIDQHSRVNELLIRFQHAGVRRLRMG